MNRLALLACEVLALVFGMPVYAQTPWFVSYEKALTAQEQGEWKESVQLLRDAVAVRDKEKLKAKTYGLRFINYLPYYHLGLAYYNMKDKPKALESFDISLRQGEIADAAEEYERLETLRAELGGAPEKVPGAGRNVAAEKSESSSPDVSGTLPWYVNYETGLAYIESGDWLKAIENLKLALAANGIPRRYARTYGMWFVTYVPYFYLGLAYYNQGLWQFAVSYFETSERLGELKDLEAESANLKSLLNEARKRSTMSHKRPVSEELKEVLNTEITEAIRLFNREEYDQSRSKFDEVLRLDPYNSIAKSYIGKIPQAPGESTPEPPVHEGFSAGVIQLLKGNHEKAIKLLKSAETAMRNDAALHAYLGVAYSLRYRASAKKDKSALGSARQEFRSALALDPSYQLDRSLFSRDVLDLFQSARKNPPQ